MKRIVTAFTALLLLLQWRASSPPRPGRRHRQDELEVGDVAPDFTLLANDWKPVKLSDFRGKKNVVLAFYVLAFTGG